MLLTRFARVLVLLLFLAPAVFAAEDLSGKWSGTFIVTFDQNPPSDDTAYMVAKQTGTDLTGTIGPNPDKQYTIGKGKIETVKENGKDVTKASFDISDADAPQAHFVLTLIDGHLKGKAEAEMDGHKMSAVLDMTRLK